MKFLSVVLILCSFAGQARATEPTAPCYLSDGSCNQPTVDPSQLIRLLGKGIKGRESEQVLVAACVGADYSCDQIRFVYYRGQDAAFWVGPTFRLKNMTDKHGNQLTVEKAMQKSMKRYLKELFPGSVAVGVVTQASLFIGGLVTALAAGPMILAGGLLAGGVAGVIVGTKGDMDPFDFTRGYKRRAIDGVGKSLINTEKWNWSSDPKSIREKVIEKAVADLTGGDDYSYRYSFKEFEIIR